MVSGEERMKRIVSGITFTVLLLSVVVSLRVVVPTASASGSEEWWNSSWGYRLMITVINPNSFALIEYPTNITLDTQSLISAGKMKSDGSDLRLLRNDEEINFAVTDLNTPNTKITFKSSVPANGNNPNYTLYYGNPLASDVSVSYEKVFYELIDEFDDGVIDPMWSFTPEAVDYYESDGLLYIENVGNPALYAAWAYTTGININNSEVLHAQCRAFAGQIPPWTYWWIGAQNVLFYNQIRDIIFEAAGNGAYGPNIMLRDFPSGTVVSTPINTSKTQVCNQWNEYKMYWNESSNFASITLDNLYYDNVNTNGHLEDYSFDLRIGSISSAGCPAYVKYDYVRVWQEVSREPTTITWEYVFEDAKRGTMLKISTDDKYFQFIAPDKDFGIKHDLNMAVSIRDRHHETEFEVRIRIRYEDSDMRLRADIKIRYDHKDKERCNAVAWDKHTRKHYLLMTN